VADGAGNLEILAGFGRWGVDSDRFVVPCLGGFTRESRLKPGRRAAPLQAPEAPFCAARVDLAGVTAIAYNPRA
jgi:hypothetical protein